MLLGLTLYRLTLPSSRKDKHKGLTLYRVTLPYSRGDKHTGGVFFNYTIGTSNKVKSISSLHLAVFHEHDSFGILNRN